MDYDIDLYVKKLEYIIKKKIENVQPSFKEIGGIQTQSKGRGGDKFKSKRHLLFLKKN